MKIRGVFIAPKWTAPSPHSSEQSAGHQCISLTQEWGAEAEMAYNCTDISSGAGVPDWWLELAVSMRAPAPQDSSSVKLPVVLKQTRPED